MSTTVTAGIAAVALTLTACVGGSTESSSDTTPRASEPSSDTTPRAAEAALETTPSNEEPASTTKPPVPGEPFADSFETAASLDNWEFVVHEGRSFSGRAGLEWTGDHAIEGDTCGKPDTQRTFSTFAYPRADVPPLFITNDQVRESGYAYHCPVGGNHLMTSFNTTGYSHLDFRPDRTFTDVTRICWEQNLTDMGSGKWTELAVIPLDTLNANDQRMDYTHPDRNEPGEPGGSGLKITDGVWKAQFGILRMDSSNDQTTFTSGAASERTEDKALRTPHCVTSNGDGTVTMERGLADETTQTATLPGVIPAGESVVVWSDVSYNPNKRNGHSDVENTWHWDEFSITEG